MNDREFERLLNDSIKQYGGEYLHGADGPVDTGPAPEHSFREDFLSDITSASPKKGKKPVIIKLLPFIGAAAAAAVIGLSVATIVPKLTGGSGGGIAGSDLIASSSAPADSDKIAEEGKDEERKAEEHNEIEAPEQVLQEESEQNKPSKAEEVPENGDIKNYETLSSKESFYSEQDYNEEPSQSSGKAAYTQISSYESVCSEDTVLPDNVLFNVLRNSESLGFDKAEIDALFPLIGNIMTENYAMNTNIMQGGGIDSVTIQLFMVDEPIRINGTEYDMIIVIVDNNEVRIEAGFFNNETDILIEEYYLCDFSDASYKALKTMLDSLIAGR